MVMNPPANAGDVRDVVSTPGLGRSPGGGHGNPLQYSYLENPLARGTWWAIANRVCEFASTSANDSIEHSSHIFFYIRSSTLPIFF